MLALTESSEDCACPSTSNAVAAKELERNLPDIGINFEMLLKYLQVLCCDQSKPISKVSEAGFGSSRSNNNVQFVVNIRFYVLHHPAGCWANSGFVVAMRLKLCAPSFFSRVSNTYYMMSY